MRAIKGFILFCFLMSTISACFEAPDFDIVPTISFKKIEFKEVPGTGTSDSLILYLDFKDGDGDLGLDDNYLEEPFNDSFYYLAAGPELKDTARVTTEILYENTPPYDAYVALKSSDLNLTGPLVTDRMKSVPGFENLPSYNPASCLNYSLTKVLVPKRMNAVDATYNIIDTLYDESSNPLYYIEEPLLYKKNIYHSNIEVEFFTLESTGWSEQPFDWFGIYCVDFNGRFPVLGNGTRPLEGTIRYTMGNPSFMEIFNVKTLKLRIKIRDRALHISNVIETNPFTLNNI
jgi:hypothetical protein